MGNNEESIEVRLQNLRTQQQEATRRVAQAEAKLDTVHARKREIEEALAEAGYETPQDARARVEELAGEVESVLEDIEQKVSTL